MPPVPTPPVVVKKEIDTTKLLDALYKIWDAFERSNMQFFLINDTAKNAKANKDLKGDRVEIGVRKMEWLSGARRILDIYIQPTEETETEALYVFDNVPVVMKILDDSDCIMSPDSINYRYETFKIPNTIEQFDKIYG